MGQQVKQEWVLQDAAGKRLEQGQTVKTFRGEEGTLTSMRPPLHLGSTGRVTVQLPEGEREFYPGVINAKWVLQEWK